MALAVASTIALMCGFVLLYVIWDWFRTEVWTFGRPEARLKYIHARWARAREVD